MTPQGKKKVLVAGFLLMALALGLNLILILRGGSWGGLGTLLLGSALLLVGFGYGAGLAGGLGLGAIVWTLILWSQGWLGADMALAGLGLQMVSILFPKFFWEAGQEDEQTYAGQRNPVGGERDTLRGTLADLRRQAEDAERSGRETDALFHAGREISKLLTLSDTLEFSREVIHDTLKQADHAGMPMFVVALVDEERSIFNIGAAEGLDEEQVSLLDRGLS